MYKGQWKGQQDKVKGQAFLFYQNENENESYVFFYEIEKEVVWVIRKLSQGTIKQYHFLRTLVVFFSIIPKLPLKHQWTLKFGKESSRLSVETLMYW